MPPGNTPVPQIRAGLVLLLEAFDCAEDAVCDPWDFAVEIATLFGVGLSLTHLRWLSCKNYVQHAVEYMPRGDDRRLFLPSNKQNFRKHSCFVLTPEGRDFARSVLKAPAAPTPPNPPAGPANPDPSSSNSPGTNKKPNGAPSADTPKWNARQRRLLLGMLVIKEFRAPAPNQELVLATFEEDSWEERIDDPLPPIKGKNAKRRLHDTISALNRHQRVHRLHFTGDGTGNGIRWEIVTGPQLYLGQHEVETDPYLVHPSASDASS